MDKEMVVVVFDNLVQPDPEFAGETKPVKVRVDPCQLSALEDVGRRASEAGERFVKRFVKVF